MYETILVPTDGSDHAVRAAEHAGVLARAFDAAVDVLAVVDLDAAAGPFDAGGVSEEFVERLESEGGRSIRAVEDALGDVEPRRTAVERGTPPEVILEDADEHGVDLIAMGTHGRTGLRRYVVGSATEHVVRHAGVPVLAARATERSQVGDGYGDLLVPTDGSAAAEVAVEHALALAGAAGARIHAVNVVDVATVTASPEAAPPTVPIEELESQGEDATERIAERAREAGVEAVTEVREGSPADALLSYADERDVDLIVAGTHGRTGLGRILLGSTTEQLVRHADVPVLAVGAEEAEEVEEP